MTRLTLRPAPNHFDYIRERLFRHPSVQILSDDDHTARVALNLEMSKSQSDWLVDILCEHNLFSSFFDGIRLSEEDIIDLTLTQVGRGSPQKTPYDEMLARKTLQDFLQSKGFLNEAKEFED
jgi:hypothetical protein